jgi:hypothetical protein
MTKAQRSAAPFLFLDQSVVVKAVRQAVCSSSHAAVSFNNSSSVIARRMEALSSRMAGSSGLTSCSRSICLSVERSKSISVGGVLIGDAIVVS